MTLDEFISKHGAVTIVGDKTNHAYSVSLAKWTVTKKVLEDALFTLSERLILEEEKERLRLEAERKAKIRRVIKF